MRIAIGLLATFLVMAAISAAPVWAFIIAPITDHTATVATEAVLYNTPATGETLHNQAETLQNSAINQALQAEPLTTYEIDLKLVLNISTTRTTSQIQNAFNTVETSAKDFIDLIIDSDQQTTREPFEYRLKVIKSNTNMIQIYPDLVLTIHTTQSKFAIDGVLDNFFGFMKEEIRILAASDTQTTITDWHFHFSTGSVDELE